MMTILNMRPNIAFLNMVIVSSILMEISTQSFVGLNYSFLLIHALYILALSIYW